LNHFKKIKKIIYLNRKVSKQGSKEKGDDDEAFKEK